MIFLKLKNTHRILRKHCQLIAENPWRSNPGLFSPALAFIHGEDRDLGETKRVLPVFPDSCSQLKKLGFLTTWCLGMVLGGAIGLKGSPSKFCFYFPLSPGSVLKTQNWAWRMKLWSADTLIPRGYDNKCFYRSFKAWWICSSNLEASLPSLLKPMWCFNYRVDGQLGTWIITFTLSRQEWVGRVLGCCRKAHCKCIISQRNLQQLFQLWMLPPWTGWFVLLLFSLSFFQEGFSASPREMGTDYHK